MNKRILTHKYQTRLASNSLVTNFKQYTEVDMFFTRCRLCLDSVVDKNYVLIEDFARNMLETLIPSIKLDASIELKLCESCANSLQVVYQLKASWLEANETVKELVLAEQPSPKSSSKSSNVLCCLCGKTIQEVIAEEDRLKSIEMIEILIPELGVYYMRNVSFCKRCVGDLTSVHVFVNNALRVEDKTNESYSDLCTRSKIVKESNIDIKKTKSQGFEKKQSITHIAKVNFKLETIENDIKRITDVKEHKKTKKTPKGDVELSETAYESNPEACFLGLEKSYLPARFECEFCPFTAKKKGALTNHMRVHKKTNESTTFGCFQCGFATKYKSSLKTHILLKHRQYSEINFFYCDFCDYHTQLKGNLKLHTVKHIDSSSAVMYKCKSCTFETKHKMSLHIHSLKHR